MDIYAIVNTQEQVDTSYYIRKKYNMGAGLNFNGEIGYKLDKHFVFSINTLFLNNQDLNISGNYFTEVYTGETYILNEVTSWYGRTKVTNTSYYYGQRLSFTPKVTYYVNYNKFKYEVSIGPTLSYLTIHKNIENIGVSTLGVNNVEEEVRNSKALEKYKFKKNNHISDYFAFAAYYGLSSNLDLRFSAELNCFLGFKVSEGYQYYSMSEYVENGVVLNSEEDINHYDSNSSDLSNKHYNFNTYNLSIGVRYYLSNSQ